VVCVRIVHHLDAVAPQDFVLGFAISKGNQKAGATHWMGTQTITRTPCEGFWYLGSERDSRIHDSTICRFDAPLIA